MKWSIERLKESFEADDWPWSKSNRSLPKMTPRRPFTVEVEVQETRKYVVYARTPEEAEDIVASMDDLDFTTEGTETEIVSAYPGEEKEDN